MESRISQLKTNFGDISDIRTQVKNFFEILQVRINKLKLFYSEFIKHNKSELFVFGLDSLHFQSKLIDIEYDDMKRLFLAINNRMYCEYFKLYKIIVAYITENTFDKKIMELIKGNNFPIYKDLEPFKEYDFDIVLDIHENILLMLNAIIGYLEGKEHELTFHIVKKNIGLNIDNFISSFNFDITMIKEKLNLFITYIEFFHKLHTKQLQRFSNKIQLMYSHVNKDIRFDENIDINNNTPTSNDTKRNGYNSSDTDGDGKGFLNDAIVTKKNPLMLALNNNSKIVEDEQSALMNEAFSNVESKCDLLLNSNLTVETVPGITIDQFDDSDSNIKTEINNVNEILEINEINEITVKNEITDVKNEILETQIEDQFFGFKPIN